MVRRRVVTFQTRIVANFRTKDSQRGHMTNITPLSQDSMGHRKRSGAVNFLSTGADCRKPSHCYQRDGNRQPKPPTSKGMGLSEILQIDPPSQFLGCSDTSQHVFSQYRSAITACTAPSSNNA